MGAQAVRLLHEMGYRKVGHYAGGMHEWVENGGPVESGDPGVEPARGGETVARTVAAPATPKRVVARGTSARRSIVAAARSMRPVSWIERLADLSYTRLIGIWVGMVLGLGVVYWLLEGTTLGGLREGGDALTTDGHGFLTSLYFSFVTATSIGFGDVVPVGVVRLLAIVEGAAALLVFSCLVSKLVSRHQEELAEETHRLAFEDRLGRVRTNLHLVLSELQTIAGDLRAGEATREQTLTRLESAAMVFSGELRTVHDLLYRPQEQPEENVIEGLLANLAVNLDEMARLFESCPEARKRSQLLDTTTRLITRRASEICGDCVPREYAPELKVWMNRIQERARVLEATV